MQIFLTMVCSNKHENYFGHCLLSWVFSNCVSETSSKSIISCEGGKIPTQLGPLERAIIHSHFWHSCHKLVWLDTGFGVLVPCDLHIFSLYISIALYFITSNFKNAENHDIQRITLPVVYYGYENWSLILWEEFKLQLSENNMLKKTVWAKKVQFRIGLLNDEKLGDLYKSYSVVKIVESRRLWWARDRGRMWEDREFIQNFDDISWEIATQEDWNKDETWRHHAVDCILWQSLNY
jgi:hypothetical protein